jgi:hypothetical protein
MPEGGRRPSPGPICDDSGATAGEGFVPRMLKEKIGQKNAGPDKSPGPPYVSFSLLTWVNDSHKIKPLNNLEVELSFKFKQANLVYSHTLIKKVCQPYGTSQDHAHG